MKKLIVFLFAVLPCIIMAQETNFTLEGKIPSIKGNIKIYLVKKSNSKQVLYTTISKNGSFQFKGLTTEPYVARIVVDYKNEGVEKVRFYQPNVSFQAVIQPGKIVATSPDSVTNVKVSGTADNEILQKLQDELAPVDVKMNELSILFGKATQEEQQSESFRNIFENKFKFLEDQVQEIKIKIVKEYPSSIVALDVVTDIVSNSIDMNLAIAEPTFNLLSDKLKASADGKKIYSDIEKARLVAVGAIAPEISQPDTIGKTIKLSDFRGKYVLVDFWASWCGPRKAENPNVVKAYTKYKDKNFTILGISLDDEKTKAAWLKAIVAGSLTWYHASDLKGWKNEAAQLYQVKGIPCNFLIDPTGKIIAKNLRGNDLHEKLKEVLGE